MWHVLALRADIRWREQSEISAGYLKRTVAQRQTHAAVGFYSNLYSPEPIDSEAVEDLPSSLSETLRLPDSDQRFLLYGITDGSSILTSKIYRQLCSPTVSSSSLYPFLPSIKWTELWRSSLHPQRRNTWYRTLHNKLPCRSNLYMPSKICLICSGYEETPLHFLFECSQKLAVWSSLWDSQFELPFLTYSLRCAIFLLEFPNCHSNTSTILSIFFETLLLALWRNHWSFVFDGRPFPANIVIASAKQLLFISLQESLLSNRVSPLPLPHVQLP
ncbi:hypothetical protein G6F33_006921 [Rhizopus arrhizus]|uniref:Reverse transcriptase zinc-binding domain-containing protein n=1 Tax=Rhizopus oryzae TaxID=64495 RepID=A0A9P6X586_RHIOR|nr:hypothetical protein G6F33_006921 [Rhizopus arrhizus]KAG0941703.1 hypothetical protein G6F32_008315 [Rhizopus arrhizus]KAG1305611.1 hypothetical protein G6F64_008246 [Rhizopus arrhizus]